MSTTHARKRAGALAGLALAAVGCRGDAGANASAEYRPGVVLSAARSEARMPASTLPVGQQVEARVTARDTHGAPFVSSSLQLRLPEMPTDLVAMQPPVNHGDGVYAVQLTGCALGYVPPQTVFLGELALDTALPGFTVVDPNLEVALVARLQASATQVAAGDTAALQLALTTPAGEPAGAGALAFGARGGGSTGSFSAAEGDGAAGRWRTTFTAQRAGTPMRVDVYNDGVLLALVAPLELTVVPGQAVRLEALAPDIVAGVAGGPLDGALQVAAYDVAGNRVPGAQVQWQPVGEIGTITVADAATDARGEASAQLRLGAAAGLGVVQAQLLDHPASAELVVASAALPVGQPGGAEISAAGPVVADGADVAVVRVRLWEADGSASVGRVPTFVATDTGGSNLYRACPPTDEGGVTLCGLSSRRAEAKALRLTAPVAADAPAPVVFVPGPAAAARSALRWSIPGPVVADGAPVGWTLTLADADGNPLAGAPAEAVRVRLHPDTSPSGPTEAPRVVGPSAPADPQGAWAGSAQMRAAGVVRLAAELPGTVAGLASPPLTATPWRAARLRVGGGPASAVAGVPWAGGLRVWAEDGAGRQVTLGPDSVAAVSVSASPLAGSLMGQSARLLVAGEASFAGSGQALRLAGAGQALVAQALLSTGPAAATWGPLRVLPAAAAALALAGVPAEVAAAAAWPQVTVSVRDAFGNLVVDGTDGTAAVSLALEGVGTAPVGALLGATTVLASAGQATVAGVSTPVASAGVRLVATASLGGQPVRVTGGPVVVRVGPAAAMTWLRPPPAGWVSGSPLPWAPALQIVDAGGNPVTTGADAAASVALASSSALVPLSPAGGVQVAAAAGLADFAGLAVGFGGVGTTQLMATKAPTSASGALVSTSGLVAVGHGPAAALRWQQTPAATVAGVGFSPWTAQVVDAAGQLVTSGADATAQVQLSVAATSDGSDRSGQLSGALQVAAVGGVATFSGLRSTTAGAYRVVATKADTVGAGGSAAAATGAVDVTVTPAAAAALAFVAQPGGGAANVPWAQQPAVAVQDGFGNLVASGPEAGLAVGLAAAAGSGALVGTTTVAAAGGRASFAGLRAQQAGAGQQLLARAQLADGSWASALSSPYAITPGPAAALAFVQSPADGTAAALLAPSPQVAVRDAFGNVVSADALAPGGVLLAQVGAGGALSGQVRRALVGGVADFAAAQLALRRAGAGQRLRATATVAGQALAVDSGAFTIAPAQAVGLRFLQAPTAAVAGAALAPAPQVAVEDAWGNRVAAGADAVASVGLSPERPVPQLPGTLAGGGARPAAAGLASFAGSTLALAGDRVVLRAEATHAAGPAVARSAPFAVLAGPAAALRFVGAPPAQAVAGLPWGPAPRLQVVDAQGNAVTTGPDATATLSLGLAPAPGAGTLTSASAGAAALPAAAGGADFAATGVVARARAGSVAVVATKADTTATGGTSAITAMAGPLAILPGAAAALTFAAGPADATAHAAWAEVVVRLEDADGSAVTRGPDAAATVQLATDDGTPLGGAGVTDGTAEAVASAGVARFPGLRSDLTGSRRLVARKGNTEPLLLDGVCGSDALTTTSSPFVVTAGPAAALAFATAPGGGVAGLAWAMQPAVAVVDAFGNQVATGADAGLQVQLAPASPAIGEVLFGAAAASASAGRASFAGLGENLAGSGRRLRATATTTAGTPLSATSAAFDVAPAGAVALRFARQPASATLAAGPCLQPSASAPAVEVVDGLGNRVVTGPDAAAEVQLSVAAGAGALLGGTRLLATQGLADFAPQGLAWPTAGGGKAYLAAASLSGGNTQQASASFTVSPAPASALRFAVQPGGGPADTPWAQQPVVRVEDAFGNLVATGADAMATITLAGIAGGAPAGTLARAAGGGVATFSGLGQVDLTPSAQLSAEASLAGGSARTLSLPYAVSVGTSAALVLEGPAPTDVVSGEPWPWAPVLTLRDGLGHVVQSGADAAAMVTLSLVAGAGTLGGTLSLPLSAGRADFAAAGLALDPAGPGRVLRARKAATSGGGALTVDTPAFAVVHSDAARLAWSPAPVAGAADVPWAAQPAVRVLDLAGNLVDSGPDASVSVSLRLAGGEVPSGTAEVAAVGGVATFAGLGASRAGANSVVATKAATVGLASAGRRGTPELVGPAAAISVVPGAAARLTFAAVHGDGTAGVVWPGQPQVRVEDGCGNLVTSGADASVQVSLVLSGGGALSGSASQAAAAGLATFAGLSAVSAGFGQQLTASAVLSSGATISVSTPAFTTLPGAATRLRFLAQPSSAAAGAPLVASSAPVVQVLDTWGNVVTVGADAAAQVTLSLQAGSGSLGGATTLRAVRGTADFVAQGLALTTAGPGKRFRAAATLGGTAVDVVSNAFAITPAPATALAFVVQPGGGPVDAAWAQQPVVQVQDAFGNRVATGADAGVTVSVSGLAGGAPTGGPLSATAAAGLATFAGLGQGSLAPAARLQATATLAGGPAVATSAIYAATLGTTRALVLTRAPSSVVVSREPWLLAPRLALQDSLGHLVTTGADASATVTLSLLAGAGTLGGTLSLPFVAGEVDFAAAQLTLDLAGGGRNLLATKAATADSGPATATIGGITVLPGDPAQLRWSAAPTAAVAGGLWSPAPQLQMLDAAGNLVATGLDAAAALTVRLAAGGWPSGTASRAATAGQAAFADLALTAAGTVALVGEKASTVAASAGGRRGTPAILSSATSLLVTPAAASQLLFARQPGDGVAGGSLAPQPIVQVADPYGNWVTAGSDAAVAVALQGVALRGALTGTLAETFSAGSLALADVGSRTRQQGMVLVASAALAGGPATVLSAPFAVLPGPADHLAFVRQPGGGAPGLPWPQQPVVALRDAYDNVVDVGADAADSVAVSLVGGLGALGSSGGPALAATAGVADLTTRALAVDQVGADKVLRASASTGTGVLTADSLPFAVSGDAGTTVVFATQPGGGTAGVVWAQQPVVEVRDGLGRRVTTGPDSQAVVTLAAVRAGTGLSGTLSATASAGVATFGDLQATQAGSLRLRASATTSVGPRQGLSAAAPITNGPAAGMEFVTAAAPTWVSQVAASPAPAVGLLDAWGNRVTTGADATATVRLALSQGSGALTASGTLAKAAALGLVDFADQGPRLDLVGADKVLTVSKDATSGAGSSGPLALTSATLTVVAGPATHLAFATAPGAAVAGSAWGTQPVVELRDAANNLVASGPDAAAVVTLATSGGATLLGSTSLPAAGGRAAFAALAQAKAGAFTLTASKASQTALVDGLGRRGGAAAATTIGYTVAPAAADHLAFAVQPGGGTAGAAWATQPIVQVRDPYENVVTTGADAAAAVALSVQAGPGPLLGTATLAASAGQASFAGLKTNQAGGAGQLRATATLASSAVQALSAAYAVVPAAADHLSFALSPGGGVAQLGWAQQPRVEVRDVYENVVTTGSDATAVVALARTGGTGTLAGAARRAAAGGVADFSPAQLSLDLVGADKVLTASTTLAAGARTAASPAFAITPGAATQLRFQPQPGGGVAHAAWASQPVVQILDAAGNTVTTGPDATATVTLTHSQGAGGALNGTASRAAVGGVATFSGLSLDTVDAAHQLSATKADTSASAGGTGAIASTSQAFAVTPAAASRLAFAVQPGGGAAGSAWAQQPAVQVQDAYGNRVTSGADAAVSVTLSLSPAVGSLVGMASVAASGGQATFSGLWVTAAGSRTLAATATLSGPGSVSATSSAFGVTYGAPSALAFTTQPSNGTSAAALSTQPVVQVQDGYGNLVSAGSWSTATIALSLSSGSGRLAGTAQQVASGGVASFSGLSVDVPSAGKVLTAAAIMPSGPVLQPSAPFTIAAGPTAAGDWPFDAGTQASYLLSSASTTTFAGGTVALTAASQSDDATTAFAGGTGTGAAWDAGQNILRLGSSGGCDGLSTNCSTLDPSWAPRYSNIVGYWQFEGTGNVANNASVPATIGPSLTAKSGSTSAVSYVAGKLGKGIALDGSTGYLAVPDGLLSSAPFSVGGWVKPSVITRTQYPIVFSNVFLNGNAGKVAVMIGCRGGGVLFTTFTSNFEEFAFSPIYYSVGQWSHHAIVFDGQNGLMYHNGHLSSIVSNIYHRMPANGLISSSIGKSSWPGDPNFFGVVDEMAIWNTALSEAEIAHIYARQSAQLSGTFTSSVKDSLQSTPLWGNINWKTSSPHMKKLPNDKVSEVASDYPSMTSGLMTNLYGTWRLDEGRLHSVSGGDFLDAGGSANPGILGNLNFGDSPFDTYGPFGPALFFSQSLAAWTTSLVSTPVPASFMAWAKQDGQANFGPIMGLGNVPGGNATKYDLSLYFTTAGKVGFYVFDTAAKSVQTSKVYADGQWHHVMATISAANGAKVFVDGVLDGSDASLTTPQVDNQAVKWNYISNDANSTMPNIGGNFGRTAMSETAIWTRELSASEVQGLWRRGANRLRIQLRACQQLACADQPAWQGPDGTNQTYFSELSNLTSGKVSALAPNISLSGLSGRYLQFRVVLESDDLNKLCSYPTYAAGASSCSPELRSLSVGPVHYDLGAPSVQNVTPLPYNQLTSLTVTTLGCPGGVSLALSPDGSRWFYYNGSAWVSSSGSVSQSTTSGSLTPTVMASFAQQVGSGSLVFRAFLLSDGLNACVLDRVQVGATQ